MRPSGKDENARMALQRTGEDFRTLYAQANTIILDRGDRRLGNARSLGQLILAQVLELAKNSDGFSDAHGGPPLGGAIVFHQGLR